VERRHYEVRAVLQRLGAGARLGDERTPVREREHRAVALEVRAFGGVDVQQDLCCREQRGPRDGPTRSPAVSDWRGAAHVHEEEAAVARVEDVRVGGEELLAAAARHVRETGCPQDGWRQAPADVRGFR
jgi:hypothetical protein